MDAARIGVLGAAALAGPRGVPATSAPVSPASGTGAQAASADPARELFQQALQATGLALQDGAQAAGALGLNLVPSLLAALTPPQPAEATAATASATTAATTPAAAAPAAPDLAAAAPAVADQASPVALPDTTGSGLDFALGTALRFGAGVGPLGAPLDQLPELSTGGVRDATAVLRTAPLQPSAGGPGPEAFLPTPSPQQVLRTYRAALPTTPEAPRLDLLA